MCALNHSAIESSKLALCLVLRKNISIQDALAAASVWKNLLCFDSVPKKTNRNYQTVENLIKKLKQGPTVPIKILQPKFYVTLFLKHSDWMANTFNQSKCLKNSVAEILCCMIFIGPVPGGVPLIQPLAVGRLLCCPMDMRCWGLAEIVLHVHVQPRMLPSLSM